MWVFLAGIPVKSDYGVSYESADNVCLPEPLSLKERKNQDFYSWIDYEL